MNDSSGGAAAVAGSGARAIHAFAFLLFFVSGFAALLYQVIWQRVLTLFSGADVYSVTIIVAAFMAGLGLGSLAGGYLADRLDLGRRILLFAAAELAVAFFAFVSLWLYYDLLYLQLGHLAISPVVLAVVLFVSLVWPTFLMGMTLPLLARTLTQRVEGAAGTIGALYGANTLGAAMGALITTWVFMRTIGFEATVALGAFLNTVAALGAVGLWRHFRGRRDLSVQPAERPSREDETAETSRLPASVWIAIYGLSGFVALSLEIVWFRLLGVMVKSNAMTFGTLLTIYLGGLTVGTLCGLWWAQRSRRPASIFLGLQAGVSIYAGLSLVALTAALTPGSILRPLWEHLGNYEPLNFQSVLDGLSIYLAGDLTDMNRLFSEPLRRLLMLYGVLPVAMIGPPTVMMGLSFPFLQRVVQSDLAVLGRRVGWLQAANIFGAMLGAGLTGWALLRFLGTAATVKVLVLAAAVFIVLFMFSARDRRDRRAKMAIGVAALVATGVVAWRIPSAEVLWADLHGATADRVISAEDGSGVAVLKNHDAGFRGETVVYTNGLGQSTVPFPSPHLTLGMLPVLLHPEPRRVAIVGLGSGATAFGAGGRGETTEIVVLEIVAPQYENLRRLHERTGDPGLATLLSDPRFRYDFGDARALIRRQATKFDVIEADALRPTSAYAGNLYSREYFLLLKAHLSPGGFAVSWAPTDRVIDTFVSVFPYAMLYEQPHIRVLIGSDRPIVWNAGEVAARLGSGFSAAYYKQAGIRIEPYLDNFAKARPRMFSGGDEKPSLKDLNFDLFPRDEFHVPRAP
jgi:spermidine synthase